MIANDYRSVLTNPAWHALQSIHQLLGVLNGAACRYHADVSPFAALQTPSETALTDLAPLLLSGESVWVIADALPQVPRLVQGATLPCLQMWLPASIAAPEQDPRIVPLSCHHAPEMVALTDVAFPGFFRQRTCAMGNYFGIRSATGELIAMAGERLHPDGLPEISGVCTHPNYRGRGLAASLIWAIIAKQRWAGLQPWLYVTQTNHKAIALYRHMGFQTIGEAILHNIAKDTNGTHA